MKDKLAAAGRRINVLSEASKADALLVKCGDGVDEVFEGAAKSIQPPDNQHITLTRKVHGFSQTRSGRGGATGGIGKDAGTTNFGQRVALQGKRLFGG